MHSLRANREVILACVVAAVGASAAPATARRMVLGRPALVSQTPAGTAGNNYSGNFGLAVSGDGRSVAFSSLATDLLVSNLLPSYHYQLYVHSHSCATVLASDTATGEPGDNTSERPSLSFDGSRLAFLSAATNFDPASTSGRFDAYVKNLATGALGMVSTSSSGEPANGPSTDVAISGNGRKVAFVSTATNLDPSDTDTAPDVYVKDLPSGRVTLVSIASDGSKPEAVSPSSLGGVSLSANGRWVAFATDAPLDPSDQNHRSDVYVRDLWTGRLILASAAEDGTIGDAGSTDPTLTAFGEAVAFRSSAGNLGPVVPAQTSEIYKKNLATGALSLISTNAAKLAGNESSSTPAISGNGRIAAFASYATNLVANPPAQGQLDVYVKNLATGRIVDASYDVHAPAGATSLSPALPYSGSSVTFASNNTFTLADSNRVSDVYRAAIHYRLR